MDHRNKHTLKKRIRRVISLCIFTAIILFGVLIIYMTSYITKSQAILITRYYSYFIGNTMNSDYFLKQLGINGLEEFNANSPQAQEWVASLKTADKNKKLPSDNMKDPGLKVFIPHGEKININLQQLSGSDLGFLFAPPDAATQLNITLNGREIYVSSDWSLPASSLSISENDSNNKGLYESLLDYFRTESVYPLLDSEGNTIGSVNARIDSGYTFQLFISIVIIIAMIGLLCLIAANIFSRFFIISITKPLNQLDDKIKAIASGDYMSTINAQIILKKPLKEIESFAISTNQIMHKMKEYNETLESQKVTLEIQNEELEAQNEELFHSRKRIEETQAQLVQSEKMASVGQLTAAITHEINTPLGAINSNVQLFSMFINLLCEKNMIASDEELSDIISQMKEANDVNIMACERVIQIIKSLKTFTKLDQAEFQEADINESLKSVLILTSNLWKRKIVIHEEYGSIPFIRCYSGLLNQVFMNIIVNAIQSINNKGDIFIRTYSDIQNVYISIMDTGSGIKKEHLPRIFEAGFSTKGVGVGSGLGLSICSNIIDKHNGDIKVSSEEGKGSEFIISLPLQPINMVK